MTTGQQHWRPLDPGRPHQAQRATLLPPVSGTQFLWGPAYAELEAPTTYNPNLLSFNLLSLVLVLVSSRQTGQHPRHPSQQPWHES